MILWLGGISYPALDGAGLTGLANWAALHGMAADILQSRLQSPELLSPPAHSGLALMKPRWATG